jgi:uncharacterized protein YaiE (UPF0345 family)
VFETSVYFNGKVKSIAFNCEGEEATIGVMAPGEYQFGTSQQETMKVVSGKLTVKLPDEAEWKVYAEGEQFIVEADKTFEVKVEADTSYLCLYR